MPCSTRWIESFFGTFKQEWANHHRWLGLADSRASTHDYIEVFYSRQRLHREGMITTRHDCASAALPGSR